jgi:hypothetical protein
MKSNIKVTFGGLPNFHYTPTKPQDAKAVVLAVVKENFLMDIDHGRVSTVFDPANTHKNYNLNEVVFLCAVAKILGVYCATREELMELLTERRTYIVQHPGSDVVEVDTATDQSLSRAESVAKTIHALGPFTNVSWPVSYIEQYRHLTGLVKKARLDQAQQRILEMDRAMSEGKAL